MSKLVFIKSNIQKRLKLYALLSFVFALHSANAQASTNNDILSQFHSSDIKVVEIEGAEKPVFVFDSNLAENRSTILFLMDARDSRMNGFVHKLAKTLPNMGLSSVVFLEDYALLGSETELDPADENSTNTETNDAEASVQAAQQDTTSTETSVSETEIQLGSFAAVDSPKEAHTDSSEAFISSCNTRLNTRINELVSALDLPSQRTVIMTSGLMSGCLFHIDNIPAIALITMNPFIDNIDLNKQLSKKIAATELPVLDLVSSASAPWSIKNAEQRRISAARALKAHYRQREIVGHGIGSLQTDYVSKEIYGWLTYLGY